ncbi:META domain-containing protein [Halomonas sp. MCCC 1A17488]|uniref:META domain-containing protein n=1 Tax=Billgrantia sulfidoxydans TaxID=2733484 RepID=A0ABX7WA14_9GAMM|nr:MULTISPECIES: META domain-containing protein [Halomonas]MCE8017877.1 META domain-containing protein [Halomonas sp. MCCC 1A17488]MCG3241210.1 META domain-containing protein [Halomonas sp. MCCC 1A17488]QPP49057.1 META domain-containing protein [Halomonas sp. SS10-MC5]QTP56392.1 META domain-containing protein [Halomonas sulfidoxydans]
MMKTLVARLGLMTAAAALLAACGSQPSEPTRQEGERVASDHPVVGPRWNLLLVGTDERLSMPETPHFTVSSDGRVSGSDGCNQLNGRVRLDEGNRIQFSELATTRRGCAQLEDAKRVTGMMENAYRFLIDHDRLVLFGPDQRVLGGWKRAN